MAEYIISKCRIILAIIVIGLNSCSDNNCENKIPTEITLKSINLVLKDKRYQKSVHNKIRIERNNLIDDIQPFKIDSFSIEMINKLKESDSAYNHVSTFYFYKYTNIAGGGIEIEFTVYPSKKYVKFYFAKDENKKWKLQAREDWQF